MCLGVFAWKSISKKKSVASSLGDIPLLPAPVAGMWMRLGLSLYRSGTVDLRFGNGYKVTLEEAVDPKRSFSAVVGLDGRATATSVWVYRLVVTGPLQEHYSPGY